MHMADALISPSVGGTMWTVTGALIAYSAHKLKGELDERKVPLMGVLGAFIFSAMMINFSIPGTGSSGHIGGGMILSILARALRGFSHDCLGGDRAGPFLCRRGPACVGLQHFSTWDSFPASSPIRSFTRRLLATGPRKGVF